MKISELLICIDPPTFAEPDLFQEWFEVDETGTVLWKQDHHKARKGSPAGHVVLSNNRNGPFRFRPSQIRIGFKGGIFKAEEIAFTVQFGRFPKGRVLHRDNNVENNAKENLIEIG